MNDSRVKRSIATGELQLGFRDKITHYSIVGFTGIIPVLFLFIYIKDYLNGTARPLMEGGILLIIIPCLLALIFFVLQKSRLKLKVVETDLTRDELDPIINKVASELDWIPQIVKRNVIIAKTFPGFLSGSWGEQITILFEGNRVLINSICDPSKKSSIVSMGRNKENVEKLIKEIKRFSSQSSQ